MSVREPKRSLWLPEWLQSSLENPLLGVDPQRPVLGHPIYWLCQLGVWGSLFMLAGIAFLNDPFQRGHVVPMGEKIWMRSASTYKCKTEAASVDLRAESCPQFVYGWIG